MGKTVPEVVDTARGRTQDRGQSFSQYGPKRHAKLRKKRGSKKDWVSEKVVALYGEKYLRHMIPDILTCTQPFLPHFQAQTSRKAQNHSDFITQGHHILTRCSLL